MSDVSHHHNIIFYYSKHVKGMQSPDTFINEIRSVRNVSKLQFLFE